MGSTVDVDERWIELDYGELDGTPLADLPADLWMQWRGDVGFTPPGGESLVALGERVRAACDELAPIARERDVVVVTHVSPVKAALLWALGVEDSVSWRAYVEPASITRIDCRPTGPVLLSFNTPTSTMPG
jgi:broad specificity phosphatase PhoE